MKDNLRIAIKASLEAGKEVMAIYEGGDFYVESKADNTPLTIADQRANSIINEFLIPTKIPIISEENKQLPFSIRKDWEECWIVDPLDGTKEFIKRNGEFTINIALIEKGCPVLGIIYVPVTKTLYFADVKDKTALKVVVNDSDNIEEVLLRAEILQPSSGNGNLRIVGSRSHMNEDTLQFIGKLKEEHNKDIEIVLKGSSLKFCLVAEGQADIYPRFAPTMEWDTAAGQAICEAAGLKVLDSGTGKKMAYNRENLINNYFLVSNFGQGV